MKDTSSGLIRYPGSARVSLFSLHSEYHAVAAKVTWLHSRSFETVHPEAGGSLVLRNRLRGPCGRHVDDTFAQH